MKRFLDIIFLWCAIVGIAAAQAPALTMGVADGRYLKPSADLTNRAASTEPVAIWEPAPPAQSNGFLTGTTSNIANTGYASPIGVVPMPFNAVQLPIRNFRADFPNRAIWVRIKDTDGSGAILAEGRMFIGGPKGQLLLPWVRLDRVVNSTSSLFLEYTCSGRVDRFLLANASTFSGSVAGNITGGTMGEATTWSFGSTGTLATGQNIYCRLGLLQELPSQVPVDLQTTTWRYTSSTDTFTSWAGPIGTFTIGADKIVVPCWPVSGTVPLTQARVVVRSGTSTGTILGQASLIGLNLQPGRSHNLTYRLDRRVPAGTSLWVEVNYNGPSGFLMTAAGAFSSPTARYSTSAAISGGISWLDSATQYSPWVRIIQNDPTKVAPSANAGAVQISAAIDDVNSPFFLAPRQFYVVPSFGVNELPLYWRQMTLTPSTIVRPDDAFTLDVSSGGNPTVVQDAGRVYYTGGTASTGNTITWTAAQGGRIIAQQTSLLNIVANTSGSGLTRRILVAGDSISDMALGGDRARWMAELVRLFNGDVLTITQIGVKNAAKTDSTAVSRSVRGEGRSGWTVNDFFTNASSPFVFSSSFNFAQYLSTNSITMSSNDYFVLLLGTNDVASAGSDAEARVIALNAATQISSMSTNARAAVPGLRVVIMTIPTGSSSQDAFGTTYGGGQNRGRFQRNAAEWNRVMAERFDDLGSASVGTYVCYAGLSVDPETAYPTTSTAINAYLSTTYAKVTDPVHPGPSGNWQIAYALAVLLKALG